MKSGQLVMIRHGTSMFNKNHQFTGWLDPEVRTATHTSKRGCTTPALSAACRQSVLASQLAPQGIKDAEQCGDLIRVMHTLRFDYGYASALVRTQKTLQLVLEHAGMGRL